MIFKHNFEIGLENINKKKEVTNKSLLQYLENSSSRHSDSIKDGITDIIDNGVTWVLLEWKMEVINRPKYGDVLEIHTWIRNSTKLYTYRDFEIYVNGEKKVIASAKWLVIDINTLRPLRITDELLSKYEPELDKRVFEELEFEKVIEQEKYEKEIEYPIRKSDIDINDHVHNLNYLDMVYEILDIEELNNVRIVYKKEIKYNDRIKVFSLSNSSKNYIKIVNIDNNIVNSLIELY
jgi:acyl-ACP thioesterase